MSNNAGKIGQLDVDPNGQLMQTVNAIFAEIATIPNVNPGAVLTLLVAKALHHAEWPDGMTVNDAVDKFAQGVRATLPEFERLRGRV